jgi:hypothetical protein
LGGYDLEPMPFPRAKTKESSAIGKSCPAAADGIFVSTSAGLAAAPYYIKEVDAKCA